MSVVRWRESTYSEIKTKVFPSKESAEQFKSEKRAADHELVDECKCCERIFVVKDPEGDWGCYYCSPQNTTRWRCPECRGGTLTVIKEHSVPAAPPPATSAPPTTPASPTTPVSTAIAPADLRVHIPSADDADTEENSLSSSTKPVVAQPDELPERVCEPDKLCMVIAIIFMCSAGAVISAASE